MNALVNIIPEDGHGEVSMTDLDELKKALEIGYTDPPTGFDSLRVESLEGTLKSLTYNATNLALWNRIPKLEAYSTIEEYNKLTEYGSEGGGFVPSGQLPEEDDTTYVRANQQVKYLGTTRSVHHPSTLVRTVPPDVIGQETQNGALWLMGKANTGLYYGDADAIPVSWNGLAKQIIDGSGNIIDMAGAALDDDTVEDATQLITDNYGVPSALFSNSKVFSDFSKAYFQYQRWSQPGGQAGIGGTPMTGFNTVNGRVDFVPDTFVKRGAIPPSAATSDKAPAAPTFTPGTPATDSSSSFVAGDAGTYKYQITAVNRYGESAPSALSAGVTFAAGEICANTITDGGGANPATAYKVYRTEVGGSTTYYIGVYTPRSTSGGVYQATTAWTDSNAWRPRTYMGLLLDMSTQAVSFKQLAPMLRMPLAIISPAIRWMQLLYGTPIIYAPKKHVLIKNIGVA